MSAESEVMDLELQWSNTLRLGCAPNPTPTNVAQMAKFLDGILAAGFFNIDYLGTIRDRQEDFDNCVKGLYVVYALTDPVMDVYVLDDNHVVVIGTDEVDATVKRYYGGKPQQLSVGGNFIWTDIWVKSDDKGWQCVAHHGSKLEPRYVIRQQGTAR